MIFSPVVRRNMLMLPQLVRMYITGVPAVLRTGNPMLDDAKLSASL